MSDSEKRRRTGLLPSIRCFEDEEEAVREKASDCGMSVGQFMLAAALQRRTKSKVDKKILNELRRLGGLQKHLFTEGAVFYRESIRQSLLKSGLRLPA